MSYEKWYAYFPRSAPMTDNYFSSFRLAFLFSVRREWPLLLAISLWQRFLAGLDHPLQGAQYHRQKNYNEHRGASTFFLEISRSKILSKSPERGRLFSE